MYVHYAVGTLITCEKLIKTYENSELVEWNWTTQWAKI